MKSCTEPDEIDDALRVEDSGVLVPILGDVKDETDDSLPVEGADKLGLCERTELRGDGINV